MNIWDLQETHFIVIPTNLQTRSDGTAVLGAGLAKQAAQKFPTLEKDYGYWLLDIKEPDIFLVPKDGLILFPTKYDWKQDSNLELIQAMAWKFGICFHTDKVRNKFAVPKLGCGLGKLNWERVVKPTLEKIWKGHLDQITFVE